MYSNELDLIKERVRLRTLRNRFYTIAYFGNYSAQVRQYALVRIEEIEKQMEELNEKILKERGVFKLWKKN